ncbi:MAG: hypothetical protein ABFR53_10870, partial [Actinomycetota bacterium]
MSRNETEGETESYHSACAQAQWIIVVSPSDLAALGHLPHSVREGKNIPLSASLPRPSRGRCRGT